MFRNPLIDFGVLLLAVLLIFGPKRLPSLGRGLGQGMKEFKEGITGKSAPIEDEGAERPALNTANSSQPAAGSSQGPAQLHPSQRPRPRLRHACNRPSRRPRVRIARRRRSTLRRQLAKTWPQRSNGS